MASINYSEKKREKGWYEQSSLNKEKSLISTILHSKIFFSPERRRFESNLMKNQKQIKFLKYFNCELLFYGEKPLLK